VEGRLPRLVVALKLWSGRRPDASRVELSGVSRLYVAVKRSFKLCGGSVCVEEHEIVRGVLCETKECEALAEELLRRGGVPVTASLPGAVEPAPSLLAEVGKVPELAVVIGDMLACRCLDTGTIAGNYEALREILGPAPRIPSPNGRWEAYLAEGGLVVASRGMEDVCLVYLGPLFELTGCLSTLRLVLPQASEGEIRGIFSDPEILDFARRNPNAFIGLLATLMG